VVVVFGAVVDVVVDAVEPLVATVVVDPVGATDSSESSLHAANRHSAATRIAAARRTLAS
jgi:hypothetical protein